MSTPYTQGTWAFGYAHCHEFDGEIFGVGVASEPDWTSVAILSPAILVTEQDIANARLISAAPDLLKAMQDLFGAELEKCMAYDGHDDQMLAVDRARAAIAKATGEGA